MVDWGRKWPWPWEDSPISNQIDLFAIADRLARRWWLVVVFAGAGGILAMTMALLLPARYRAESIGLLAIDPSRTYPVDENAEREIYLRVQDVLLSDDVLASALTRAAMMDEHLAQVTVGELRENIRLYDLSGQWRFVVLDRDAARAAELVNAWVDSGIAAILTAESHALKGFEAQRELFQAACRPGAGDLNGYWICSGYEPEGHVEGLSADVLGHAQASLGIPPVMTTSILEKANASDAVSVRNKGLLMVAGVLVGILTGTLVASSPNGRTSGPE